MDTLEMRKQQDWRQVLAAFVAFTENMQFNALLVNGVGRYQDSRPKSAVLLANDPLGLGTTDLPPGM